MKNKFVLGAAFVALAATALTSCGPKEVINTSSGRTVENGKIGFILPGMVGGEMQAFQTRWEELGAAYGIEVVFKNFQGTDPSYYSTIANELIALECDAIVCNFEMDGKETVIEKCVEEEVYVAYSGSSVSDEDFEEWKTSPYFIGQIAPSPEQEKAEAREMTKHFLDMYYGENKIAYPEGTTSKFAVWPVDFHGIDLAHQMTYRWMGVKQALEEYGAHITGDDDGDSFKWKVNYDSNSPLKDNLIIMGNNLADDTLNVRCKADLDQNPNTVIVTSSGDYLLSMFAGQNTFTKGTRFACIDSLNDNYNKWYKANSESQVPAFQVAHDPYVIGKYIACNEPVFALCAKAFAGEPIRDENNTAVSINQKFWRAKDGETYAKANKLSRSFKFGKEVLDGLKTVEDVQNLLDNTTLDYVAGLENK